MVGIGSAACGTALAICVAVRAVCLCVNKLAIPAIIEARVIAGALPMPGTAGACGTEIGLALVVGVAVAGIGCATVAAAVCVSTFGAFFFFVERSGFGRKTSGSAGSAGTSTGRGTVTISRSGANHSLGTGVFSNRSTFVISTSGVMISSSRFFRLHRLGTSISTTGITKAGGRGSRSI